MSKLPEMSAIGKFLFEQCKVNHDIFIYEMTKGSAEMKTVRLEYELRNHLVFWFTECGDLPKLTVNGVDKSSDGNAIEFAIAEAKEHHVNLALDISQAFDELSHPDTYRSDPCYLAKSHRENRESHD